MSQLKKQTAPQGQLSFHQPEGAGDYIIDTSSDFSQIGDEPASASVAENAQKSGHGDEQLTDYAALIEAATPAMKQYFKAKIGQNQLA